jgi:hypothetical protein
MTLHRNGEPKKPHRRFHEKRGLDNVRLPEGAELCNHGYDIIKGMSTSRIMFPYLHTAYVKFISLLFSLALHPSFSYLS